MQVVMQGQFLSWPLLSVKVYITSALRYQLGSPYSYPMRQPDVTAQHELDYGLLPYELNLAYF